MKRKNLKVGDKFLLQNGWVMEVTNVENHLGFMYPVQAICRMNNYMGYYGIMGGRPRWEAEGFRYHGPYIEKEAGDFM